MNGRIRRLNPIRTMLIGLVLGMLVAAPAVKADTWDPADWAPMVWSDKADYAPGERVELNGAHWTPGETVHIRVNDDTGASWDRDVDVTADETGAIADEFNLPNWFVAQYRVTATGASGAVATHMFTDSSVTMTFPGAGATYTLGEWDAGCGTPAGDLCGTAEGSNVTKVQVSLKRNSDGRYWDGSSWVVATEAASFRAVPWNESTGNWSSAFSSASFSGSGSYTAIARILNKNDNEIGGGQDTGRVTRTFTIQAKQDQTISFPALANQTYGDADVQLNATASSGLPVSYSTSGPCSLNADKVHINGAGSCTVTASQAGNANFNAAAPVNRSFMIAKRAITVTADAQSKTYGVSDPALTYKLTSGSLVSGDSVTGALGRAAGETVAGSPYAIQRGTLSAGSNYDLTFVGASLTITKKALTVGGAAAQNKMYDGTKAATVDFSQATLQGVVTGDAVSIDHSGSQAAFDDANVGAGKPVTVTGVALAGAAAGNYSLAQPSGLKAGITARPITVTADAKSKVYGDDDPALTYKLTSGSLVTGDGLTGALTRATGETVADSPYAIQQGTLAAGSNYDLAFVGAKLTITKRSAAGSFKAADKVYDGNRDAQITLRALTGVIEGDDVALVGGTAQFDSKDVGADKAVTGAGFELAGEDKGNYSLESVTDTKGSITAKELTGHFTAADKVYDGNRDATITGRTLDGVVATEAVSLAGGTAQFDSKDVGSDKTVTGTGFALAGGDNGNYSLGSVADTKASVTPK